MANGLYEDLIKHNERGVDTVQRRICDICNLDRSVIGSPDIPMLLFDLTSSPFDTKLLREVNRTATALLLTQLYASLVLCV
ncbi:hypothetical protein J6590_077045 [Homalodisca vitripennis]|nr:hypothetical protein J6590_077045 [Homalodisca vitripennis]